MTSEEYFKNTTLSRLIHTDQVFFISLLIKKSYNMNFKGKLKL